MGSGWAPHEHNILLHDIHPPRVRNPPTWCCSLCSLCTEPSELLMDKLCVHPSIPSWQRQPLEPFARAVAIEQPNTAGGCSRLGTGWWLHACTQVHSSQLQSIPVLSFPALLEGFGLASSAGSVSGGNNLCCLLMKMLGSLAAWFIFSWGCFLYGPPSFKRR